jgi:hypothetical protein
VHKPTQFTYSSYFPTSINHLGCQYYTTMTSYPISLNANIRNIAIYTFIDVGTLGN